MSKELSEAELELEVMGAMSRVEESEAASASVSRRSSIDFYRRVAEECSDRAATIQGELGAEESEEDEC